MPYDAPAGELSGRRPSARAAARELGLTIPDDLTVVGYDNHPMSAVLAPRLTTFDWRSEWLVEKAVDMVVEAIGPRRPQRRRFVIVEWRQP